MLCPPRLHFVRLSPPLFSVLREKNIMHGSLCQLHCLGIIRAEVLSMANFSRVTELESREYFRVIHHRLRVPIDLFVSVVEIGRAHV